MEAMLGTRIGTYRMNWFEVTRYFLLAWGIPLVLVGAMLAGGDSTLAAETVLLVSAVAYIIVLAAAWFRLPRIEVYEHGIRVAKGSFDQSWQWRDLSRMEGTRTTFRLNMIPVLAYGANHIYAGDEKAFSISVFTARPSLLAEYVIMKLAARDVPVAVEMYRKGTQLNIGNIAINQQGLGTQKNWIDWMDVRDVRYQEGNPFNDYQATIIVDTNSKKRPQKFGNLAPGHAFMILGVMDEVRGTDKFARLQEEHFSTTKRAMRVGWRWAKLALLIGGILGAIFVVVFVIAFYQETVWQGKREALVTMLGIDAPALCDSPNFAGGKLSNRLNKFAVIDAENDWIHQPFHDAVEADQRATSREDVTAIICLRERRAQVEECLYGDEQFNFEILRFRRDYEVDVLDMESGDIVVSEHIRGSHPNDCPNEADSDDSDIIGPEPSVEQFMDWFRSLSGGTA